MAAEPEPGVDELVFYPRSSDTVDAHRYLALRDGRFVSVSSSMCAPPRIGLLNLPH